MEGGSITDQNRYSSFRFSLSDEKMKLTDIHPEDDDFLVASTFCEYSFPEIGRQSFMRRSLAWDSAFFNSAGVLDLDELSFMNRGFRKAEMQLLPGAHDVRSRRSESESTPNAHDLWFEFEPSVYNPISCNALKVFDKSPESELRQKGMQNVRALKKIDESSRSKMKSYQTSVGRSIDVQREGKTKKEPTSRRRNGTIPSPLPQKAISSATNISTKLNILSAQASSVLKRETDPTSKIWRYSGRSKRMGNDTNASTRSFSLASSKRMSMETKDSKEASTMKGSLQSSMSSANSSWASPGTCLSTQALRPSGLRPPSPLTRFSRENSAPSYNGETRTRKLPQKVISKGTTFGCSTQSDSACKKLKTPCSDVPKNIKRPKIESSNTSQVMKYGAVDQENGMKKKLSYSFDHLENLSRYFEAIDLNQGKRVDRPNKIDVENHGVPVPSLLKRENQLLKSLVSSSKACQMRTPLSDKTFSCNFSGTSMERKRGKSAKKASSVYATSKVLDKENI
ncbi:hypothetical protein ACS0TY_004892 [Phlomoides rotata]